MRNLYLSDLMDYIAKIPTEFGIDVKNLTDIKSATSASKTSIADDLYRTLYSPSKSNLKFYLSRTATAEGEDQKYGIRVHPRDIVSVHNDCDLDAVFAGCSEMKDMEALNHWIWFDELTSEEQPKSIRNQYIKALTQNTATPAKDIGYDTTDFMIKKREDDAKRRMKLRSIIKAAASETKKVSAKAAVPSTTSDEEETTMKDNDKLLIKGKDVTKRDEDANGTPMTDAIKFHYDPEMQPATVIEKFIEFYGIQTSDNLGINDTIEFICNNPNDKNARDMAVTLYHLFMMATQLNQSYNDLCDRFNNLSHTINEHKEQITDFIRYKGEAHAVDKWRFGTLRAVEYKVTIKDTRNNDKIVARFTTKDKNMIRPGFILDQYGFYVPVIEGLD